jgi:hypothetical protein
MPKGAEKGTVERRKATHSSLEIAGHLGSMLLAATAWAQMTEDEAMQAERSQLALRIGLRFERAAQRFVEQTTKKKDGDG